MTILLLPNPTKSQSCLFASSLKDELTALGISCVTDASLLSESPDLAVIAGGDGTVLRYLDTVLKYDVPVFGVNFGHRGFLTEFEPECAREKILEILKGENKAQSRILYECKIYRPDGTVRESFTGLNEAVLSRGSICRAIDFTVCINQSPVLSFPADGIITATPTGSTAYNFSAQGPILMPDSESLVITPICASSLLRSSLVTAHDDVIEFTMCGDRVSDEIGCPSLVADGFRKIDLDFDEKILIKRSERTLKLYGGEKGSFLKVLQQKMT